MNRALLIGLAAAAAALCFERAAAQTYPTQTIKFIVPFAAGSATDTLARLLGSHVSKSLGQPVLVENQAGGSGVPAALNVVRARPDGYTIFITSNTTHAANQSMLKRVPYDAISDFEPITRLGTITLALVGHPSVPAGDVRELIAYAKANPGKLTFGAGSTSSRAAAELMKTMAGIDMLHVPISQQSAGGHRPAGWADFPVLRRHLDLAAAGPHRPAERLRGVQPAADAARARSAGARRVRIDRLRPHRLVRVVRPRQDAQGDHRQAQRGVP